MEWILMALFGGGTLDWQDIGQTEYDWEEIFERARMDFGMENVNINTLYQIILEIALEELALAMCEYKGETSEDFKNCSGDIYSYFDIWCNCLDTKLTYIGENELLGKEIQDKMADKIEEINDKIGFTYINFD